MYDFFPDFFVKFVFLQQLYCYQYNRAAKTRLTANGKPPEPKLVRTCSLSQKKAMITFTPPCSYYQ